MADTFLHGVEVITIDAGSRPISTVRTAVIGIVGTAPDADPILFPANTPVLIAGSRREAAGLDKTGDSKGTLPSAIDSIFDQCGALIVVVRVEEGATEAETLANVIGGVNAVNGQYEGVHALLGAESVVGYRPRIICVPGFTHQRPDDPQNEGVKLANPVVAELLGITDRMRAVVVADGPNTNDTDAYNYAKDFGSKRVFVVDPAVYKTVSGELTTQWASASVAGLIARTDNDLGWWWSPSNQLINGIQGTARPIDFTLGDPNSRANLLNENKIATIIRDEGFRLWGNRTLSDDPKWAFLCVVRTADIINDSLLKNHRWAVDRGITKNYVTEVTEGVKAYLRYLTNIGAILGGDCWADPDLNTPDQIAQGKVYWDFDFTPVYPAEHLTFRSHLVNDYISEIF